MKQWMRGLAAVGMLGLAALFQGCEVDSANDVQRTVGVDFTGYYRNPNTVSNYVTTGTDTNGVAVVTTNVVHLNVTSRNSGMQISSLDLRQNGDRLEAIDNAGNVWKGSLGEFNGTSSSFELVGKTSTDVEGRFSGTLTANQAADTSTNAIVGNAQGIMTGTYIEDDLYGTFYAAATIPGIIIDSGGGTTNGSGLIISPSSMTLASNGASQQFTASGGSGNYTWTLSSGSGSLSSTTGSSVNYVRTSSGNNTITVTDGTLSAQAVITQP